MIANVMMILNEMRVMSEDHPTIQEHAEKEVIQCWFCGIELKKVNSIRGCCIPCWNREHQ